MGRTIDNHLGKRYGSLVIIAHLPNSKNGNTKWLAQCDCGEEKVVYGSHLKSNHTKACGINGHRANSLPRGEAAFNRLLKTMKRDARRRGYIWDLTKEHVRSLTKKDCFYCGRQPEQVSGNSDRVNGLYAYNGLDRVDNQIGYIDSNVIPCCKYCNRAKSTMTQRDFIHLIGQIYRRLGEEIVN